MEPVTQISLSKAFVFIDEERGRFLRERGKFAKGSSEYRMFSSFLKSLNRIKKELALVSDADQLPLGL
jgi:hypothetical protein